MVTLVVGAASAPAVAPSYGNAVLADAPAGFWRLGETSGTTAADASANRNAGKYLQGVTLGVPGALPSDANKAASFDGGNDLVSVADPASGVLDFGTGDFSVEAWIRATAMADRERGVVEKRETGPYWYVTVTDDAGHVGALRIVLYDGSTTRTAYSVARVDDSVWHHVVVTVDRDWGFRFYVDGAASGVGAHTTPGSVSNDGAFKIGKVGGYSTFKGDLDEVAVYPTLLTAERVAAHYGASGNDTTPPVVTLASPLNGSSSNDTTPTFAGSAGTSPGDSSTLTVKVYKGSGTGGALAQTLAAGRPADGSYSIEASPELALGTYTAQAEQEDAGGNLGLSAATTFTIAEDAPPPSQPPSADPVLVGAGDIASCGTSAQDDATATLIDNLPGAKVFVLGDNAYTHGTPEEYAECYDPTWGRFKDRTHPAVGGHDYSTPGAAGYFGYFGAAAGDPTKGYYSYDVGSWHVIVLNSECAAIDAGTAPNGCAAGSPQEQWLRADLAAHPTDCTLAYWHDPRFSSGPEHPSSTLWQPFWDALYGYGADLVVGGSEHVYERFLPQTPDGTLDLTYGITQIIAGTGGYLLYSWGAEVLPNSAARNVTDHGVLKLTLHSGSYSYEFIPVAGKTYTDSGTGGCHGAPGTVPAKSDITPPVVTLTDPAEGSATTDATPPFAGLAGRASGDSATVAVKVYAGADNRGTLVQTMTATAAPDGSYSVDPSPELGVGTYTAQAEQSDAAGNTGLSVTATFDVEQAPDTTAPAVTLTAPENGSVTTDTTPTFAGMAGTALSDSTTVAVKVYAGADNGGTLVQTLSAARGSDGSYSVDAAPGLPVGKYTAQSEQSDAAGNTGLSAAATFDIILPDTTAPEVTLTAPEHGSSTTDKTPTFAGIAGTAGGDSATVTIDVYPGTETGGTSVLTLTATPAPDGSYSVDAWATLVLGTYTAQARQSDASGNTGASVAVTFYVVISAYANAVLADAPNAYWRLDETSGTIAADETGAAPGTYQNGVTLGVGGAIVGEANGAARFDGLDDQVGMGDPASGVLDFGTGDFSLEAWVKTTINQEECFVCKRGSGAYYYLTVTDDGGYEGRIRVNVSNGSIGRQVYGPAVRVDDGAWHHVVVIVDRDTGITVYVDGTSRVNATPLDGSVDNSAAFVVGKVQSYRYFQGDLDEVAVYPRVLPGTRVQAHYDAGRGA